MELPEIYEDSYKITYVGIGILLFIIMYMGVSRILIFNPTILKRHKIDYLVPFIPWGIWIYLSIYPFLITLFFMAQQPKVINALLYAYSALMASSCMIYWFFPTMIPRWNFKLDSEANGLGTFAINILRKIDHPTNCLPSLHVSATVLFIAMYFHEHVWYYPFVIFLGMAIIWSTMAIKQHFFIDVLTGAIFGGVFYFIFYWGISYY